jgi:hypothetical protein
MSHAVSDALIDPVRACRHSLQFRLGVQFHTPGKVPPLESLLPARYLRIQVASLPPDRIDGSRWQDGLRVHDGTKNGREFDESDPTWKQSGVFPLGGISPLDQPSPDTLVLDRWLDVPAVPPTAALTTTFTLITDRRQRSSVINSLPPSQEVLKRPTTSSHCPIRRRSLTARSWRWQASPTTARRCFLSPRKPRTGLPSASAGFIRPSAKPPTTSSQSNRAMSPLQAIEFLGRQTLGGNTCD